ncbi:hypothetical protein GCM10029992_54770 [Glycomyces albus]
MLKVDGATRAIARVLYERVAAAPIVSPHGHVPVAWLASDEPFRDPVDLLVRHDHYVTRLLHAAGVDMEAFARAADRDPRAAWRTFADHWHLFAGTASGYWLEDALAEVLEVGEPLTSESADRVYDAVAARLAEPAFRPRALFRRFGIEALATTDDPSTTWRRTPPSTGPSSAAGSCPPSGPTATSTRMRTASRAASGAWSTRPERR